MYYNNNYDYAINSIWIWKWNPVHCQREIPQKDAGILPPSALDPADPHRRQTSDASLQNYKKII